jgi:hypothetical protein
MSPMAGRRTIKKIGERAWRKLAYATAPLAVEHISRLAPGRAHGGSTPSALILSIIDGQPQWAEVITPSRGEKRLRRFEWSKSWSWSLVWGDI